MLSSKVEYVLDAMRRTLYLATNLEDVSSIIRLGLFKHGLVARAPYWPSVDYENLVPIDEINTGRRVQSIADIVIERTELLSKALSEVDFVWTFKPQLWADDFTLLGKKTLGWNYYSYSQWSNKHHQERLLLRHGSKKLRDHLTHKHTHLERQYVFASKSHLFSRDWIISKRDSIGGQGVFTEWGRDFGEDFLLRVEKKVWPHIPICQIGMVSNSRALCYAPSIMIIKEKNGHLDYLGSDFNISSYLFDDLIETISDITKAVGVALNKVGFTGIYNCDFIFSPKSKQVFLSEVNPRNSGCLFILDEKFARDFVEGNTDAILFQPTFLNYYLKIFGDFPDQLVQQTSKKNFMHVDFSEGDASSFIHTVPNFLTKNKIEPDVDETIYRSIKSFTSKIIDDPYVPTALIAAEEN